MFHVRKSSERGYAYHGWLESQHTFSFAQYYDPQYMGFSDLRVINEDKVAAGQGFGTHPHKNMEILSYVLKGQIAHQDSMGHQQLVSAGEFQIMSAGSGVTHSEFNPSLHEDLHFLQIWIQPNQLNIPPRYAQKSFIQQDGATLILSPNEEEGSLKVYQDMRLWRHHYSVAQTQKLDLNPQRHYWLHMVAGQLLFQGIQLAAGDALAISEEQSALLEIEFPIEFLLFDLR